MAEHNTNGNMEEAPEQELREHLQIRRDKLSSLRDEGRDPYTEVRFDISCRSGDILGNFEGMENKTVSLAGRMMSKRGMGKASFGDLLDAGGRIQLYVRADELGEEAYQRFKRLDIGDIIGVTGYVFKTRMGEISVHVKELKLLSKSLRPLPEKWHGLKDPDLRYRQRYVDLIVNPEVRRTFETRSRIIREIRNYLDELGFIEVETPVLNTVPGGAAARPFITHHNTLDIDMYLRIATELHLKRLIVGGFDRVYELGRIFRNEGMDIKHNPEFTTIELYEAYTDYRGMMELTENIVRRTAERVLGTLSLSYQGEQIDLQQPFARLTMTEAVKQYCGVDFLTLDTAEKALPAARAAGVDIGGSPSWGEILNAAFEQKAEDRLTQPCFIMDYPVEVSPLAKKHPADPRLTQRFELFITGREFANAFSELNDPIDQRERFARQARLRAEGDEEANMMDDDFVNALEYGMPPTGGMGLGIDRLVMLFTDSYSIRDVLLFPTMKPIV